MSVTLTSSRHQPLVQGLRGRSRHRRPGVRRRGRVAEPGTTARPATDSPHPPPGMVVCLRLGCHVLSLVGLGLRLLLARTMSAAGRLDRRLRGAPLPLPEPPARMSRMTSMTTTWATMATPSASVRSPCPFTVLIAPPTWRLLRRVHQSAGRRRTWSTERADDPLDQRGGFRTRADVRELDRVRPTPPWESDACRPASLFWLHVLAWVRCHGVRLRSGHRRRHPRAPTTASRWPDPMEAVGLAGHGAVPGAAVVGGTSATGSEERKLAGPGARRRNPADRPACDRHRAGRQPSCGTGCTLGDIVAELRSRAGPDRRRHDPLRRR